MRHKNWGKIWKMNGFVEFTENFVHYTHTYPLIFVWNSINFRIDAIFFFFSVALPNSSTKLANISLNVKKWMHIDMNITNNWPALIVNTLNVKITTKISPAYPKMESWYHGKLREKMILTTLNRNEEYTFDTHISRIGWNNSSIKTCPYFSWQIKIDAALTSAKPPMLHFVRNFMKIW